METYLAHHGIKGQKWGVRRWQDADGHFNEAGYERYFGGHKRTVKSSMYRLAAKANAINEKHYAKGSSRFSKQMAGMQRAAKNSALRKAEKLEVEAYEKRMRKVKAKVEKTAMREAVQTKSYNDGKQAVISSLDRLKHQTLASIFDMNAKVYAKSNPTLSSMNMAARDEQLRALQQKR